MTRDLGLQVKTVTYGGKVTSRFIDKSQIADVIINEGVTMQKVIFYLAIMLEGQDKMVVVFSVSGLSLIYIFTYGRSDFFFFFFVAPDATD